MIQLSLDFGMTKKFFQHCLDGLLKNACAFLIYGQVNQVESNTESRSINFGASMSTSKQDNFILEQDFGDLTQHC